MSLLRWGTALALVGAGAFWGLTRPAPLPADPGLSGDAARGAQIFAAGGCASCHAAPGAEGDAKKVLAGGRAFATPFGTFHAPNISPSPAGIGGWSTPQFLRAMQDGVSPEGQHYYPAFPYTSYALADPQDMVDLKVYLDDLPEDDTASLPHELPLPFQIRRGLGLWKQLYAGKGWVMAAPQDAQIARGRYLVEALGHCGECHTPRDMLGGPQRAAWLSGAANPSGPGRIPGIDPASLDWAAADIAYYLESGFTPSFDTAGGHMVEVVENTAQLPAEDRDAIAAYLKALPGG
jgi:mono/diheme cytochrome c family protein